MEYLSRYDPSTSQYQDPFVSLNEINSKLPYFFIVTSDTMRLNAKFARKSATGHAIHAKCLVSPCPSTSLH